MHAENRQMDAITISSPATGKKDVNCEPPELSLPMTPSLRITLSVFFIGTAFNHTETPTSCLTMPPVSIY